MPKQRPTVLMRFKDAKGYTALEPVRSARVVIDGEVKDVWYTPVQISPDRWGEVMCFSQDMVAFLVRTLNSDI